MLIRHLLTTARPCVVKSHAVRSRSTVSSLRTLSSNYARSRTKTSSLSSSSLPPFRVASYHSLNTIIPTTLLLPTSFQESRKGSRSHYAPLLPTTGAFDLHAMSFSSSSEERRRQRLENRNRRRQSARVMEKEREEEQQIETVTGEPVSGYKPSGRSQIDSLTAGQSAYIRNVWGLVGANLGVCSVGTITAMTVLPVSPLIPGIASLGFLLGLTMGAPKGSNPALRAGLLGGFAFTTGMTLGPPVGAAMGMDPLLVPMALGASSGIFVGATAFSMFAPEGRLLALGGPLFGGVLVLLGCGIVNMIWGPYPVLSSLSLYGGLGIFTLFVAYDTQQILDDYKNGVRDTVQHSIGLFIDFVAIFRRVLMMLMMRGDD